MRTDQLLWLKAWFDTYTRSFLTGERPIDNPLVLKIEHTTRVCDIISNRLDEKGSPRPSSGDGFSTIAIAG